MDEDRSQKMFSLKIIEQELHSAIPARRAAIEPVFAVLPLDLPPRILTQKWGGVRLADEDRTRTTFSLTMLELELHSATSARRSAIEPALAVPPLEGYSQKG